MWLFIYELYSVPCASTFGKLTFNKNIRLMINNLIILGIYLTPSLTT